MSLAAFSPGMCLLACPRVFRCWGLSCLSNLSSHCSQWLARGNHVLVSRVCFLGRYVGLAFLELKSFEEGSSSCASVMFVRSGFDIPSKQFLV